MRQMRQIGEKKKWLALVLTACLVLTVIVWKGTDMIKNFLSENEEEASLIIESPEDENNSNLRDTVLYYKDDKGFLVPVMRKIPWPEGRGIAKATIRALVDNPANRQDIEAMGLEPVLPANTDIIGMSIENGYCKVNFTSDFLNYNSSEEETALVNSLVYTLTEFPTISEVEITVNGKNPKNLTFGYDVANALNRQDINYMGESKGQDKVVVYYQGTANGLENYYVPMTVDVNLSSDEKITAIKALEKLVEGPPVESGLYSLLPDGVEVINVDVVDGTAYVNFTEEIRNIDDPTLSESIVKSIALTLKEYYKDNAYLDKVSILADGEEIDFDETSEDTPAVIPTFANEY